MSLNVGSPFSAKQARDLAAAVARTPITLPVVDEILGQGFPSAGRAILLDRVNALAPVAQTDVEEAARLILAEVMAGPPRPFAWSQAMPPGLKKAEFTLYGNRSDRSGGCSGGSAPTSMSLTLETSDDGSVAWVCYSNTRAHLDAHGRFQGQVGDETTFSGRVDGDLLHFSTRTVIPAARMSNGHSSDSETTVSGGAGGPGFDAQNRKTGPMTLVEKYGIPVDVGDGAGRHVHRRGAGVVQGASAQHRLAIVALRDGASEAIALQSAIATAWRGQWTNDGVGPLGYPMGALRDHVESGRTVIDVQLFEKGFITSTGEVLAADDPAAAFNARFPTWKPPLTEAERNAAFQRRRHEDVLRGLLAPIAQRWGQLIAERNWLTTQKTKQQYINGKIDELPSQYSHLTRELKAFAATHYAR